MKMNLPDSAMKIKRFIKNPQNFLLPCIHIHETVTRLINEKNLSLNVIRIQNRVPRKTPNRLRVTVQYVLVGNGAHFLQVLLQRSKNGNTQPDFPPKLFTQTLSFVTNQQHLWQKRILLFHQKTALLHRQANNIADLPHPIILLRIINHIKPRLKLLPESVKRYFAEIRPQESIFTNTGTLDESLS